MIVAAQCYGKPAWCHRVLLKLSPKAPQNTEKSKWSGVQGNNWDHVCGSPPQGADGKCGISSKFYVSSLTSDVIDALDSMMHYIKAMICLQIIYENWCFGNMGHVHFVASWVSGLNTTSCVQRLPRLLVKRHWCRNTRRQVHTGDPRSNRMNTGLGVNGPGFLF